MTLPPLVDEANLQAYLDRALSPSEAPVRAERIDAGHSNLTFFVSRGAEQYVLRRPPRPPYLPTAHDVAREYRVIAGLTAAHFPVPQPILLCEDTAVIGAPFYLMQRIEGAVVRNKLPAALSGPAERAALADELIRALVALHTVDYTAAGLGTLGKPDGYIARQVKRWVGQLDGARTRDLPDLDAVSAWLQGHIPESPAATIVHGDFRLDNAIYASRPPVKLLAVLDWEMSTLGDPLADLGYLLSFWREPGEAPTTPLPDDMGDVTASGGFPGRAEVAARYEELSGRKVANLNFYIVLAIWKLAILLEGSYKRHQLGTTDDPFFAMLDTGVPALARRARAMI
ncbi:MAG: phosphotransferase family protein [Chloroflexi bacterium]|nr:phosphotransferase family protein [Chloroflexota bacterium]